MLGDDEFTYQIHRDETTPEAVVKAVAEREGVRPRELPRTFADVVDPDGLDRLVTQSEGPMCVWFLYAGWLVGVTADQVIVNSVDGVDGRVRDQVRCEVTR